MWMNEEKCVPVMDECVKPMEEKPALSEIMDKANCLAADTLAMARRLNSHLFNTNIPDKETDRTVMCFSDALLFQAETLKKIHDELAMICKSCGAV